MTKLEALNDDRNRQRCLSDLRKMSRLIDQLRDIQASLIFPRDFAFALDLKRSCRHIDQLKSLLERSTK